MLNKEKNFVSAVIYVHNDENTIGNFLKAIIHVLETNFEHSEIICVNDDSRDGSLKQIKALANEAKTTSLSVVNLSYYHGIETAMHAGIDLSIGDFVFEFDNAVLDFEEKEILNVYYKALEGYDIVSCAPDRALRLSSGLFYKVFNRFSNDSGMMTTESFRILSRRVINRIGMMNRTVPYRKAVYASTGLKTEVLEYKSVGDEASEARDPSRNRYRWKLAIDTLMMYTDVGYTFSIVMTLLMMLISVLMLVYTIVTYITSNPVAGWTTTVLFVSFAFMGLFGILTIVIKYLNLLMYFTLRKKDYTFENIEKLTK